MSGCNLSFFLPCSQFKATGQAGWFLHWSLSHHQVFPYVPPSTCCGGSPSNLSFRAGIKILEACSDYTSSQLPLPSFEELYSVPFFWLLNLMWEKISIVTSVKNISSARTWTMANFVHNTDNKLFENKLCFVSELNWSGVMKNYPCPWSARIHMRHFLCSSWWLLQLTLIHFPFLS